MHRSLPAAAALVVLALAPLALACRPVAQGGDELGTFQVHGVLEDNGCAPGLEPRDPIDFQVQLRRERSGALSWRMMGGPPNAGRLEADGSFRVQSRAVVQAWPADPANEVVGCSLTQIETVEGALAPEAPADAGAPAPGADAAAAPRYAGFTATSEIDIQPVAGTDCSALLLVNGGSFPALPCGAAYALEGTRAP